MVTPDPACDCTLQAGACDDGNACTLDLCALGACSNTPLAGGGCCTAPGDCAAPNACQQSPTCDAATCTYIAKAGNVACCNAISDCTGTATCVANTCTCGAGTKYCDARGCIPNAECCTAAQCDSTNSNGATCTSGACSYSSCKAGHGDCVTTAPDTNGCETDLTGLSNCGGCGNVCNAVNASAPACDGTSCSYTCNPGFGDCIKVGANTDGCESSTNTTASCGACGRGCSSTNTAVRSCAAGVCTSSCAVGFGNCSQPVAPAPDDGCEVDLTTSSTNCGACGRGCSANNAPAPSCAGGLCNSACSAGFGNCTQPAAPTADDGCETDLNSTGNCGACGRTCSLSNVSVAACTGGLCTSTCSGTFGNCSQPVAPAADDGCEVNLASSAGNCGGCGRACSNASVSGAPTCSGGLCTSACVAGHGNCARPAFPTADDGCEVSTSSDPSNCSGCGVVCNPANASAPSCVVSVCAYSCNSGFADCLKAGANTDGCETNLSGLANCGGCGNVCNPTNASAASCNGTSCSYTCTAGFGDCARAGANTDGCETNLTNDPLHCGSCVRACSAVGVAATACAASLCTSTCNAGLGNCTRPAAPGADDGCETDLMLSTSNCGGCGRACDNTETAAVTCSIGVCTSSCLTGFGNCSRPVSPAPDNGCETTTSSDPVNCNMCGSVCPAPTNACQVTLCASSACGYVSTGGPGCCNAAATCGANVCQNVACTANRCVFSGKAGVLGCCNAPADCPAQSNPCLANTCTNNTCGTMVILCGDGGVDMTAPEDMVAPLDLTVPDLGTPDLATPDLAAIDLATPDLSLPDAALPLSLTGGGGCFAGGGGEPASGLWIAAAIVLLLAFRRRIRRA